MLRTRLAAAGAANKENAGGSSRDMDAPMSVPGRGNRTIGDAMDVEAAVDGAIEERPRGEALQIALTVDLEVVIGHVQWRNPALKPQVEAHHPSVTEGVDGATSACFADGRSRVLGRELSPEGEERHAELVRAAKIEDLDAWGEFDVPEPRRDCNASTRTVQTSWALTWEVADGRKSVKAR